MPYGTGSLFLLSLLLAHVASVAERLQYDARSVFSETWRLLTCHWTHWSREHLFWSLLAFVVLGTICERRDRRRFFACLFVASMAIPLWLRLMQPGLALYRGLSGIDSALFVLLAVALGRDASLGARNLKGRSGLLSAATLTVLVAFVGKLAYEFVTGSALFVHAAPDGFAPVPLAHLAGAVVGAVVGIPGTWSGGTSVGRSAAARIGCRSP